MDTMSNPVGTSVFRLGRFIQSAGQRQEAERGTIIDQNNQGTVFLVEWNEGYLEWIPWTRLKTNGRVVTR